MAKWGEGDSRWIVEERDDGVNVNGWHWEEKDRIAWARQRIRDLLTGLSVSEAPSVAEIAVKKVHLVEGEAAVSQRKGTKKLAVYDLTVELEWRGRVAADCKEVVGKLRITEFASHSEEDDLVVECTKTKAESDSEWETMSRIAKSKLRPAVVSALKSFPADLLATYDSVAL